jgi:hypothetical protein
METYYQSGLKPEEYIDCMLYVAKELSNGNADKESIELFKYCLGDLTSHISHDEKLKMLIVLAPSYSSKVVDSICLISKLPFENDEAKKVFNSLISYWIKFDKEKKLEYLPVNKKWWEF